MSVTMLQLTRTPIVKVNMLIRRPADEVFRAFVDPAITTRFWFTRSSGELTPGAELHWEWGTYGVSARVSVRAVEENRRICFDWNDDRPTTVELDFTPWAAGATYVQITETGLTGDGDELVSRATDATGGFTIVLCALKALLEHHIVLTAVQDAHPKHPTR